MASLDNDSDIKTMLVIPSFLTIIYTMQMEFLSDFSLLCKYSFQLKSSKKGLVGVVEILCHMGQIKTLREKHFSLF